MTSFESNKKALTPRMHASENRVAFAIRQPTSGIRTAGSILQVGVYCFLRVVELLERSCDSVDNSTLLALCHGIISKPQLGALVPTVSIRRLQHDRLQRQLRQASYCLLYEVGLLVDRQHRDLSSLAEHLRREQSLPFNQLGTMRDDRTIVSEEKRREIGLQG